MSSIPTPPTLSIVANDIINYKGKTYTISNVGSATDAGHGITTYAVTISTGVITVSADDTVLSSYHTNADAVTIRTWSQSVSA